MCLQPSNKPIGRAEWVPGATFGDTTLRPSSLAQQQKERHFAPIFTFSFSLERKRKRIWASKRKAGETHRKNIKKKSKMRRKQGVCGGNGWRGLGIRVNVVLRWWRKKQSHQFLTAKIKQHFPEWFSLVVVFFFSFFFFYIFFTFLHPKALYWFPYSTFLFSLFLSFFFSFIFPGHRVKMTFAGEELLVA